MIKKILALFILLLIAGVASATYYLPSTTAANLKSDGTIYSVGALTTDAHFTGATGKFNTSLYSAGTLNSGGTATLNAAKVNGTSYLVGATSTDGQLKAGNIKSNATIYATTTLNSGGTATLNAVVSNTTVTAPADGFLAGGVILPGEMVLVIPLSKSAITAGEINNSAWFIADDAWTITSIEEAHTLAETTAGTLGVSVQKMSGSMALTSGINLTEDPFSLKSAANTTVSGVVSKTAGTATLANGDRIGIICNMTEVQGADQFRSGAITIHMRRA
ncbi:MAG: hypothetical protein PHD64_05885 [Mesotoga sp.]|nr:hypothetical protein [Mesotoga sp.]